MVKVIVVLADRLPVPSSYDAHHHNTAVSKLDGNTHTKTAHSYLIMHSD